MRFTRTVQAVVGTTAAFLSAIALTTIAPSASAAEGGVTPYIIGGGTASNAPWAARLFANGQQTCTATIIAPTWILTAQHCVAGGGTMTFRVGSLDQQSGGTMATAKRVIQHPSVDLALAELTTSVQATYAPLGTTASTRNGQTVQIYGWGATSRCGSEINCQSRYLKVADTRVTNTNGRDYRGGVAITVTRGNGIAAGGDSGGPMFASGVQVGVASTSDRQSTSNYTSVGTYRSWIKQYAGV
ncbi:trypsin-like serine protease [Saccharothrix violaceirubra]|uniref:Secreted trypsin-like serine protease n=1 Tax=Saccharothrix violaceirubra TaxID=413306 RepID=A0A7W7SYC8_9PSEU|nr:trypsin-like serine protease [Saccharothrix violaceirubra]MBB4963217.1 secreted trypsin-like serine protease [Saccharothrix violaceirubra]